MRLPKRTVKRVAIWHPCPGVVNDGVYGHSLRDYCTSCAPFWEKLPVCPVDSERLLPSGFCRKCRHFYSLEGE